jgi:predicted P-loop ATPase
MNISLFPGNITNTTTQEQISIETFLQRVNAGFWKSETETVRNEPDNAKRAELKKRVPYVTISGVFDKRSNDGLKEYSGFLAIDIDHREEDLDSVRRTLAADPYTFSVFASVSGTGLCVVIRTTSPAAHLAHFLWAKDYYYSLADIYIDESCKDISRARFVSYDPHLTINYQAKTSGQKKTPKKTAPKRPPLPATQTQIDRLVSEIYNREISIANNYDEWIRIGFAFAHHMGEEGREHFRAITNVSSKAANSPYIEKEFDSRYTKLIKSASGSITIATFLEACKSNGLTIYTPEETQAIAIAKTAKRAASDIETAVLMAEQTGIDPKLTEELAQVIFANDYDLTSDSIITEITAHIRINYNTLRHNEFTDQTEIDGHPITERDRNAIYNKACIGISDKVTKTDINSIIDSDAIPSYHPVKEWLKTAKSLPSRPEIVDEVLSIIPYKVPEARAFLYHWFLGIPATHFGDCVRLVAVLCGSQETGKTEFFRRSLPPSLQPYFRESPLSNDDEIPLIMTSSLINVDDEFGGKSRQDALKFKEITSKNKFDYRPKYGRSIITRTRTAMLAGTSNDTEIITDRTGNTRILPIEYHQPYDFEKFNAIDKDQFLIEIFRLHEAGASWKLSSEAKSLLESLTSEHEIADYELQIVDLFTERSPVASPLTYAEIKLHLEAATRQRIASDHKLGQALGKRYARKVVRINGNLAKCYANVSLKQLHQIPKFGGHSSLNPILNTDDQPF